MNTSLRLAAPIALCLVGCGAESPGDATQLPADVARVFQSQCASCHAAPPRFGAPMPLVTWGDTQRAARSNAARPVWQLIGERVHDVARPMPPNRLNAEDMAVIDRWVAARAPGCAGGSCGTVAPAPTTTTTALPCTPTNQFLAHAEGGAGAFRVPGSSGNVNKCFAFRSTFDGTTQATAFGPRVDQSRVLHHLILFATDTPQRDGAVFDCDGNMPRDARFLAGWAPGNTGSVLPPDVGMELPGNAGWFILQVHYWNTTPDAADDASGIQLCTTATPRAHVAAVHTLGSLDIAVPPRSDAREVVGECRPTAREPVHVIGATAHMHRMGRALRTEVFRGGDAARRDMMLNVPSYSFDSQVSTPLDMVLMPGDVLRTTCTYQNTTSATAYFGERTEDEMCFNFVLAWPAGGLVDANGAGGRRCIASPR
jgi:hypothetical protein